MTKSRPDLAHLKRVIELGCADAARDAGVHNFRVAVAIEDLTQPTRITVGVFVLTPEQDAQLSAMQEAERRKREAGN